MQIRSKFQDYYDAVLAHGQDASLVYVRETREILIPQGLVERQDAEERERAAVVASSKVDLPAIEVKPGFEVYMGGQAAGRGAVFFCGKVHPFYVATIRAAPDARDPGEPRRVYSWDKGFEALVTQNPYRRKEEGDWQEVLARETGRENPAVNLQHRSPVVVRMPDQHHGPEHFPRTRPARLIVDARLQDLDFQKVVDPYTAFQEIEMFLGGVLGQSTDVPAPMTDPEKVVSHGLDPVYGFRRSPGGKRRK